MRLSLPLTALAVCAALAGSAHAATYTFTKRVTYTAANGSVAFACEVVATTDGAQVALVTAVQGCSFNGTAATVEPVVNGPFSAAPGTAAAAVGASVQVCAGASAVFGPTPTNSVTDPAVCVTATVQAAGVVTIP